MRTIIEILLGVGFFGNLIMYYRKRKDSRIDTDKQFLNSLIDDICAICQVVDATISMNDKTIKTLDEMRKEEMKKYKEIDRIGESYAQTQEKLLKIYDKETLTELDSVDIEVLRNQRDEYGKFRAKLIDEISSSYKKESEIIRENNEKIGSQLRSIYGISNRQSNTYKLYNSSNIKLISELLKQLDKAIKLVTDQISGLKSIPIAPSLLFYLYKKVSDCRFKIIQVYG